MQETDAPPADTTSVEQLNDQPPSAASLNDSFRARAPCIVALALIACAAVWHGWRKGYVLAPTDALQLVAPWEKPGADYVARNEQLFDQTVQFVPWTLYTVQRYKEGQIPLWNPYSQLGAPFMANGQSAIFYPTILLHVKLRETWSWTISAALRLFLAGLGMYLLAGRYGLRRFPRLLTAVTFMLCGFNLVWLNHPQMNVMPLLPWAVLITEMLVQRVTLLRILGATLVFFIQFLGGHPASCMHLLLTCALLWVLRLFIPQANGRNREATATRRALDQVVSGAALAGDGGVGFSLAPRRAVAFIANAADSRAANVSLNPPQPESLIHP